MPIIVFVPESRARRIYFEHLRKVHNMPMVYQTHYTHDHGGGYYMYPNSAAYMVHVTGEHVQIVDVQGVPMSEAVQA